MGRKTTGLVSLLTVLVAVSCGGCGDKPYQHIATAYHTLDLVRDLAESVDQAIGKYATAEDARCTTKHGAGTDGYRECIKPALGLLRTWTGVSKGKPTGKGVLPAVQSAQRAAAIELRATYRYIKDHEDKCGGDNPPPDCKGQWKKLLLPSLCALVEIVDRATKIGAYDVTTKTYYTAVKTLLEGFTCK